MFVISCVCARDYVPQTPVLTLTLSKFESKKESNVGRPNFLNLLYQWFPTKEY